MFMGNDDNAYAYGRIYIDIGGNPRFGNRFDTGIVVEENKPIYITYTFNPNVENEKGILYVNAEKRKTTNLGIIDNLVTVQKETNIQIGSDIHITNGKDNRYPFNGEIYAARVYNRPLTNSEVKFNYDATKLE